MKKFTFSFVLLFVLFETKGQPVEVQANYNSVGDVEFVAYNNTPAPLFLQLDFADLENTTFDEPLPYVKLLEPGFNVLFTLFRYPDAGVPRFNHQIKIFRSNPLSLPDLDFPYLIPFAPGNEVSVFDVKSLAGFWGSALPDSWNATGFQAKPGEPVFASRTGIVVEVVGANRTGEPQNWYHTWNSSVTVLHADGTLICYRNVVAGSVKLKINEKVFAGQQLGFVLPHSDELLLVIFQQTSDSQNLKFVIPQFVTGRDETAILLPSKKYIAEHPAEIRGIEMNNREKRKYLK